MESAKLKKAHEAAIEYVGKIGKAEPHFRGDNSVGRLHALKVQTEIAHQASPSGQNYWNDHDFDSALCRAVRLNFAMLANESLAIMRSDYEAKRISEKADLLAQLAEIEALESGRGA
jgi:hypothetical protein